MSDGRPAQMSSVLGADALILGNVRGQGDLEIRGKVQGNVVLNGRVAVARGGSVLGKIEALQISVFGEVRGDLLAHDGVSIGQSGDVEGHIVAPRVAIEAGARVRGNLRTLGVDEQPRAPLTVGRAPATLATGQTPSAEERAPREDGEGRGRRRRRKRGSGASQGQSGPAATELPRQVAAPAAPTRFAEAPPAPSAAPQREPAPVRSPERKAGASPLKPPAVPSFVKGSHGHRREN